MICARYWEQIKICNQPICRSKKCRRACKMLVVHFVLNLSGVPSLNMCPKWIAFDICEVTMRASNLRSNATFRLSLKF
jgi:hypothetical protein